jgi:hypothetical protein
MHQLTRFATAAAAIVVAAPAALFAASVANAEADTPMSFTQMYRRCDLSTNTFTGPTGFGRPFAVVRTTGSNEVLADVNIATAIPFTHYDVRLIQMPRPSSRPCGAGDPGVDVVALVTDAAGAGRVTVRGDIEEGATGVWIFISRPDAFRQTPAEFYTSDFVADL